MGLLRLFKSCFLQDGLEFVALLFGKYPQTAFFQQGFFQLADAFLEADASAGPNGLLFFLGELQFRKVFYLMLGAIFAVKNDRFLVDLPCLEEFAQGTQCSRAIILIRADLDNKIHFQFGDHWGFGPLDLVD